jgi:hypothetical protein
LEADDGQFSFKTFVASNQSAYGNAGGTVET